MILQKDIWFCRHNGVLYYGLCNTGDPPHVVKRTQSVKATFDKFKKIKNLEFVSVGICPPDMLGLEEICDLIS